MRNSRIHLLLLCFALAGCTATRPAARFKEMRELPARPVEFDKVQAQPSQMDAKISIKVPGLHGTASGILRHAKADQYLIELFGREELFLKVYFTGTQTVLWPAIGAPKFFSPDSTPTLRESVHSLLPDWRLDDVLPIPVGSSASNRVTDWRIDKQGQPTERINRPAHEMIYKTYKTASGDQAFPYRKVVLQGENGGTRLTWTLKPNSRQSK